MERSRADRILAEWADVSSLARPPDRAVRSTGVRASWAAPSLATATVLVVAIAVAGAWLAFRPAATLGPSEGSASPSPLAGLATWWVDPLALPLPEDSTAISGFIREQACANGSSPEGRVLEPAIEYRTNAILITFRVTRSPSNCPSNPSFPVEIRLAEPLGARMLLDGSEEPPRDATTGDPAAGEGSWGPLAVVLSDTGDQALAVGTIRITEECLGLETGEGEVALVVWPADRTAWDATTRTIAFRNMDGTEVTLRDGDRVTLGGGGDSTTESGVSGDAWAASIAWVARPAPSCPTEVRFSVGEVVTGRQ